MHNNVIKTFAGKGMGFLQDKIRWNIDLPWSFPKHKLFLPL